LEEELDRRKEYRAAARLTSTGTELQENRPTVQPCGQQWRPENRPEGYIERATGRACNRDVSEIVKLPWDCRLPESARRLSRVGTTAGCNSRNLLCLAELPMNTGVMLRGHCAKPTYYISGRSCYENR